MHISEILPKIMDEIAQGMKGKFSHDEPELPRFGQSDTDKTGQNLSSKAPVDEKDAFLASK